MKNLYNALQLKQLYQLKALGYGYTNTKPFSSNNELLELPNDIVMLKKQAQNCHLCSLSKGRENIVFGKGDRSAKVMFIGDYPMDIEEKNGEPFLGHGGEMLSLMIEKVLGLSHQEVYLTNLLKCHPSLSIELHESYMHTCKAYLFKEIALIQPKIIITLGEIPYHYLTNDTTPLAEIRGTITHQEGYRLIPTYHPNFLLKNPSLKKDVFLDLQKIKNFI
jgi:DNA polymerase